jgi:hypothetical protein
MSDMVERVARALYEARGGVWGEFRSEEGRASWIGVARVAIEAMREPTEPMRVAANAVSNLHETLEAWDDMIDAALKPKG